MELSTDFFSLFQLPHAFRLNISDLDVRYREIQTQVHPDRFAQAGDAERRRSMQWATHANEAYQTLKKPLERAKYLLQLAGHDIQAESNTAMASDFLMEQMEWREAVAEARDVEVLDELEARLHRETRELETQLAGKIDADKNYADAAGLVRKLRFMEKLAEEIHSAYDEIDN